MKSKKFLLCAVLIFFMGLTFVPTVNATMIKEVAMGLFLDAPSQEAGTMFYLRYHGPEVTRSAGPWMTRYQSWLPYEPPKEAVEQFGAVQGRYAELWWREEDYFDHQKLSGNSYPFWRGTGVNRQTNVMVACVPTDEFYDSNPHPEETTILRWVTVFSYPEGVSVEDGDKWFLETYAKEALEQPGLLKFVSHRVLDLKNKTRSYKSLSPEDKKRMEELAKQHGSLVRLCEYWYKDFDAWRKAVLESPPKYTPPSWGGEYPFVDMVSTFIGYYPDIDFLKGTYTPDPNKLKRPIN